MYNKYAVHKLGKLPQLQIMYISHTTAIAMLLGGRRALPPFLEFNVVGVVPQSLLEVPQGFQHPLWNTQITIL
ncbi:hypothetical protein E2C01_023615 [Portunus trituberculatus]|uniref:Uncharacterized protein n=1 Tax=Portunus trituberculatus TaxID=210409 RepID=A0A5B7EBL2_PORTR|nr:hypothetical protein [Portunus trituberculatus]